MADIYSNLYRYRERERRAPLEDYLTEALSDLLNRCPTAVSIDFIASVLLEGEAKRQWLITSRNIGNLGWRTQASVRLNSAYGRLDLLSESEGRPLIVVENKIRAPVRTYAPPKGAEPQSENDDYANQNKRTDRELLLDTDPFITGTEVELGNQLAFYGRWLANQPTLPHWKGGLSLLTHLTRGPPDFLDAAAKQYGPIFRSVASWAAVYRWLRLQYHLQRKTGQVWSVLANDLASFLEKNDMSNEQINSRDIAAAHLYLESDIRLRRTFEAVYGFVKEQLKDLKDGNLSRVEFDPAGKMIWNWVYVNTDYAPPKSRWYIAWGIRFPPGGVYWQEPPGSLPSVDHLFVNLGGDESALPLDRLKVGEIPKGWSNVICSEEEPHYKELVVGRPLAEFLTEPDRFSEKFGDWLIARIAELKKLMPKLKQLVSA